MQALEDDDDLDFENPDGDDDAGDTETDSNGSSDEVDNSFSLVQQLRIL